MSGLLPRSLAGRLALVLVAAVVVAQIVAITIFTAETSRVRRAAARTQEADRMATLVRVIDAVFDPLRAHFDAMGEQNGQAGKSIRLTTTLQMKPISDTVISILLAPERIGFHTQADEVIGAEIVESLSPGNRHIRILRVWRPTIQCSVQEVLCRYRAAQAACVSWLRPITTS